MNNFEVGKKYIREGFNKRFDTVYTAVMADSKGAVLENPRGRRDWYNADERKEFKEFKIPLECHCHCYVWKRPSGAIFMGTPFEGLVPLKVGHRSGDSTLVDIIPVDWVEKT